MNSINNLRAFCPNVDKSSTLSSFKDVEVRIPVLLWSSVQVWKQYATELRGIRILWNTIWMRAQTCQRAKLLTTSKKTRHEYERAKLPAGYIGTGLTTSNGLTPQVTPQVTPQDTPQVTPQDILQVLSKLGERLGDKLGDRLGKKARQTSSIFGLWLLRLQQRRNPLGLLRAFVPLYLISSCIPRMQQRKNHLFLRAFVSLCSFSSCHRAFVSLRSFSLYSFSSCLSVFV